MAFDDYAGLRDEIQSFLWDRADIIPRIPSFIRLAEAQMFRLIDVRQMEAIDTAFAVGGASAPVPEGFAGVVSFGITSGRPYPLEYVRPDALDYDYRLLPGEPAWPRYYTIVGDEFVFAPAPIPPASHTATLRYRRRPTPLSGADPVNWLLTEHPDAYLYGSLLQSAPWLHEDERIATWANLFTRIVADINADDRRQSQGATMQVQNTGTVV